MASQLINIDTDKKITLCTGTHILGRGKMFQIHDARISSKHCQLEVTSDSLIITALHENPCFYKKGGTMEVQVLRQNNSVSLDTGDRLGLLPNTHWYEVLRDAQGKIQGNEEVQKEAQEKIADAMIDSDKETDDEADSRLNPVINEEVSSENNNLDLESSNNCDDICTQVLSQYELHKDNSNNELLSRQSSVKQNVTSTKVVSGEAMPSNLDSNEENNVEQGSPSIIPDQQISECTNEAVQSADEISPPLKRSHDNNEPGQSDDVKRTKPDVEEKSDVKQNLNSNQASSSNSNDNVKPNPLPQALLRERCMYGANCYRRNPAHLAQYSHPRDADWGDGARAPCPWGAACGKRDARHWRDHEHPPGHDQPPQQRGNRKKRDRSESPPQNLVVTGKRVRKTVMKTSWSGTDESDSDPFNTDDESEWEPSSEYTEPMD